MGAAVATVLRAHGLRVVTCLEGRSARTRQRSETARLEVVSTLAQLVRTVEAVLSIVPTRSTSAVGEEIGFCRKVGCWGKILKSGGRNSMAYRCQHS